MIAGVILAAGQGRRLGQTKQLLAWGQTTILGRTIQQVQASQVDEIVVVTGHDAAAVSAIASAHRVRTVYNPTHATGELLSSLKTGIGTLAEPVAAAVVILADQPFIPPFVINQLITAFRQGAGQLLAPTFHGQRGNPVLIGRSLFPALLALPADAAPRALFQQFPEQVSLVEVETEAILLDIDRWEDYERLRPREA